MSSSFGKTLKITVFGQSHGKAIGVCVDGLPAGEAVDLERLNHFLGRRRPGQNKLTTARQEQDIPVFLSGLEKGVTCGSPLCAIIENTDTRSTDYRGLTDTPRPSHADYSAYVRYNGQADMRGGGHFSGRLTAPLCIAGGIALQILARRNIFMGAHLLRAGGVSDDHFPLFPTAELFASVANAPMPVLNKKAGEDMSAAILKAKKAADSVGGMVECAVVGLPAGVGSPMFDGLENRLAAALFGIPAVKGVEFGAGFACADMCGSAHNDPFIMQDGQVRTSTNNHGGILGGISTGMPLILRTAIKPTPSIGQPQQTVRLSTGTSETLVIHGRHDPCIALRAVPVVEAVTACVILDMILEEKTNGVI